MKEKLSTLERNQLVLRCLSLTVVYYTFQTVATRGLMQSHKKETRKEGRKPRDSNTWRRRPGKNAKLSIQCRHYYYTKPLLSRNQKNLFKSRMAISRCIFYQGVSLHRDFFFCILIEYLYLQKWYMYVKYSCHPTALW